MPASDLTRLEQLLSARHPAISIITFEEEYALDVVRGVQARFKLPLWVWSNSEGLRDGDLKDSVVPGTEEPDRALEHILKNSTVGGVVVMLDLGSHLNKPRTLRLLRDVISRAGDTGSMTLILVDAGENLPAVIQGTCARMELSFPNEDELDEILNGLLQTIGKRNRIVDRLSPEDRGAVLRNMRGLTRRQAKQAMLEAMASDRSLSAADVGNVLKFKKEILSKTGLLEFVDAPASMDEIGGLQTLKSWLNLRREAFSEKAREAGLEPPRGVLLLGVQGAGKSLAAKACATAWRRPLLRMDVGAFFNKFVGETERNLRDAFRQAEMMSPVVLWIDEIEKAFASASAESADGGLSKRMFGTLLTWMQEHRSSTFLIATANDIASLPPELVRKGRFDEIFFVDLPGDEAREAILRIHLSKRKADISSLEMPKLIEATKGYSGAEIEESIKSAMYQSYADQAKLTTQRLVEAIRSTRPLSVTMAERVAELRAWAHDRCVMAD